jgi:gamma-glutamyl phosphate reductase
MATNPTADPKQPSFDALNGLLKTAKAAFANPLNTQAARDAAYDLMTATDDQLTALNQADFTGNTVDLKAAEATLTPGMDRLKALQKQIAQVGSDMKEFAAITSGIDQVVAAMTILT